MGIAAMVTVSTLVLAAFVLSLLPFAGERRQATAYLAALLGLICLVAVSRFLILSNSPWMDYAPFITLPLVYLHGPLVYLYISASLFDEDWKPRLRRIWFALPPVVLVFVGHVLYTSMFPESRDASAFRVVRGPNLIYLTTHYLMSVVVTLPWIYASFLILGRYRREFEKSYSTEAAAQVRWLRVFLIFCAVWFSLPLLLAPLNYFFAESVNFADSPISIVPLVAIIYMIMQHALNRPRALEEELADHPPNAEARSAKPALKEEQRLEIIAKVREAMEEDQLFLEPELSLTALSEALGVQSHHLSPVISLEFKTNFYGLVSSYRVREAAMLLRDPDLKDETILNIGFRAGFNSRAALNRVFKQYAGCTPRQFRSDANLKIPTLF